MKIGNGFLRALGLVSQGLKGAHLTPKETTKPQAKKSEKYSNLKVYLHVGVEFLGF
jgi:hypothetical protein